MAMSYHRILGDHLADHLIYLSSSSSFWFSLNSSYEHDFHLSKRLGMRPKDYEYLLVAADVKKVDLNAFQGESAKHREMVNFILVVASPLVALSSCPLLVLSLRRPFVV